MRPPPLEDDPSWVQEFSFFRKQQCGAILDIGKTKMDTVSPIIEEHLEVFLKGQRSAVNV